MHNFKWYTVNLVFYVLGVCYFVGAILVHAGMVPVTQADI